MHEKSILLASLPISLLAHWHPFTSTWFGVLATFSMYPLLTRDGLALPCWALTLLFYLCSVVSLQRGQRVRLPIKLLVRSCCIHITGLLFTSVMLQFAGSVGLLLATCSLSHLVAPPPKYPHLFPLAISMMSCVQLLGFLGYLHYLQFTAEVPKDTQ